MTRRMQPGFCHGLPGRETGRRLLVQVDDHQVRISSARRVDPATGMEKARRQSRCSVAPRQRVSHPALDGAKRRPQKPRASSMMSIYIRCFFGVSFQCRQGVNSGCRLTLGAQPHPGRPRSRRRRPGSLRGANSPATRISPHFSPAFCRCRRAALCAAWGRTPPCQRPPLYITVGGDSLLRRYMGLRPNPRRPLAGTPSPHSVDITYLGLRPKPPLATRGDPIAPLRARRATPCAAVVRSTTAPRRPRDERR